MSAGGELHGVCREVDDNLLYAFDIQFCDERQVRIVFYKPGGRLGCMLFECGTDIFECLCEIDLSRFYLRAVRIHCRYHQDIIYQMYEKIAVLTYYPYQLGFLFRTVHRRQQVAETDNGIQRRAYLMTHVGQESTFLQLTVICTYYLRTQSLLRFLLFCYVTDKSEKSDYIIIIVIIGQPVYGIPAHFAVFVNEINGRQYYCLRHNGSIIGIKELGGRLLIGVSHHPVYALLPAHLGIYGMQISKICDVRGCQRHAPDHSLTLSEQIAEVSFISGRFHIYTTYIVIDDFSLQIHLTLFSHQLQNDKNMA